MIIHKGIASSVCTCGSACNCACGCSPLQGCLCKPECHCECPCSRPVVGSAIEPDELRSALLSLADQIDQSDSPSVSSVKRTLSDIYLRVNANHVRRSVLPAKTMSTLNYLGTSAKVTAHSESEPMGVLIKNFR